MGVGGLVVSGRQSAAELELCKAALDQISQGVEMAVDDGLDLSVSLGRDDGMMAATPLASRELAKGGSAPIATEALARIGQLYAIETDIAGQDPAQRLAVRREKAAPLVKDLKTWLEAMPVTAALPSRGDVGMLRSSCA